MVVDGGTEKNFFRTNPALFSIKSARTLFRSREIPEAIMRRASPGYNHQAVENQWPSWCSTYR